MNFTILDQFLTLSAVVWEYLRHCVRSHLEKPIPWYFTPFYYGIKYQSYIRKQSNYFVKSCIPQFTMSNTYFHVFVFTKASLYQVTCKGKVLHSTFKHRKLKITPQKYTWRVGYKVYFQLKNHNKIFCYTLLILCWYKNRCTKNMNHIFIYNTWTWLYLRHDKRPSLNALSQLK